MLKVNRLIRKVAPVLSAGMLLQANGCTINADSIAAGLTTSIVNSLITDLVFGLFNVSSFGF